MSEMYAIIIDNASDIYHHGIKGQKWGIRRYQNPDGTLTEEGKKRYQKNNFEELKKYEVASSGKTMLPNGKLTKSKYKRYDYEELSKTELSKKIAKETHDLWKEALNKEIKAYKDYEKTGKKNQNLIEEFDEVYSRLYDKEMSIANEMFGKYAGERSFTNKQTPANAVGTLSKRSSINNLSKEYDTLDAYYKKYGYLIGDD